MSRTTIEVPMKTNNVNSVLEIISADLSPEKYSRKIVDGESVWAKGDAVIIKMQCFSAAFTGSSVLIQAWLKDALTGESDLNGFFGWIPKKRMKKHLENIKTEILLKNI
ncbi:MAG: hypothetical protein LUH47_05100 [Clostridiales bacterium]|nr:hypothetical protein [Clostridiales bacterium]